MSEQLLNDSPEPPRAAWSLWRVLQLWFGFREEVSQRAYVYSGFGLMALKYGVEAAVLGSLVEKVYTPFDFLNPVLSARQQFLTVAPEQIATLEMTWMLEMAWMLWTLPFLWIAVSMSVRRAVNAALPPWVGMLILIPFLNLLVMLFLALFPARSHHSLPRREQTVPAVDGIQSAILGVVLGTVLSIFMVIVSVYAFGEYGSSLFLGTPVLMGVVSSLIYNRGTPHSYSASITLGMTTVAISGGVLILFAFEGLICILMAAPLALPMGGLGGLIGKMIAENVGRPLHGTAAMLVIFPSWAGVEAVVNPSPTFQVATVVEVDASPELVWQTVLQFPEIPEPDEWYFRWGIAYPIRGEIFGTGPGAIRHCVFSTGTFVEPITVWDEPRKLAFDVAEQPDPMFELSPYRNVHPPHLHGTLRSTQGEFLLESLPNGRTRLTGNTWYQFDMFPQGYWTLWSHLMIHRIHERVLNHVKLHAESAQLKTSLK